MAAKRKEIARGLAEGGEGIDPGAAGVGQAEEFGDFVEGFAGGVVHGAAEGLVDEGFGVGGGGLRGRGGCGRRRRRGR